jgi:hypothetical protein
MSQDISSEASSRTVADASLATALSVEEDRIDAILLGSDVDLDTFTEVVSFVESIDLQNDNSLLSAVASIETKHNADISTEASSRLAADNVEASLRASADSSMDQELNATIKSESQASESRDASLESALSTQVSSEASSRTSADASIDSAISVEISEREEAVQNLEAADKTNSQASESRDASLESALSSETSSRTAADSSLDTRVNDIISNTDVTAIDSFTEVIAEINSVTEGNFDSIYAKKVSVSPATDGTTTAFTLANAVKSDSEQIYLNGLLQNSDDYSITNGTDVTFNVAPENGASVTAYGVYGTFTDIA